MEEKMFCPKCGNGDQMPDSYCRQCGEWLPDLKTGSGRPFRTSTREQKVRRMRVLQMVSIGLSLGSALMIVNFLSNGRDKELLAMAALCSFLVAVYQIISLTLGYKVLTPKNALSSEATSSASQLSVQQPASLKGADTQEFIKPNSVVEDTTELLNRVPAARAIKDKERSQ